MIQIESFSVNCSKYAVNAMKLINIDSVNQSICKKKSINVTFDDFSEFKKTAL